MGEQKFLDLESAAKARERLVRSDHPVARNDDRQRVRAVGPAHRAARGWLADARRERPIGNRRAEGYVAQGGPDLVLEGGAGETQGQVQNVRVRNDDFRCCPDG